MSSLVPTVLVALLIAGSAAAQSEAVPDPPTTIQQDLQTLIHGQDQKDTAEAYIRLLDRGPAAASEILAALDSPQARGWAQVTLLDLLGEVGDTSHVPRVAAMARDESVPVPLRKMAFQALTRLPPHPAAPAAAEAVLDAPDSPDLARMAALLYLGDRPSPRARGLAQKYRNAAEPTVRGAALYLAVALGEPGAPADSARFLEGRRPDALGERIVRALSKTTPPEQLSARVPKALRSTRTYGAAETLARAQATQGATRVDLCRQLLDSPSGRDRLDAIACLVDEDRVDLLEPLVQPGANPLVAAGVRNELRRLGLRAVERAGRVEIEPGTP